jgi:hypothetical protein
MAINPVITTRQWYSYANVPFTPANSTDVQQWMLWLWKELLIGNYSGKGGTVGPEGARPATSYWTVVRSSDGAGNVASSDLWVARTNVIRATAGTNHSWIVLKSPVSGNPNGALGFGQGPVWMCIDNSAGADARARILYSRNDFSTGGTATARPTSTTEFEGAYFLSTNVAPNIWTDATYNIVRYVSIAVDANGQFYFYMVRGGSNTIESISCCVENINSDDRDLYRQFASTCYFGNPIAIGQRTWTGTARSNYWNSDGSGSTSGGMIRYFFGACCQGAQNNTQQVGGGINGLLNYGAGMGAASGSSGAGYNMDVFGSVIRADVDTYYLALPTYVLDYGSGAYSVPGSYNSAGNLPQWRGQVPDAWAISSQTTVGSSYPSAAAQTHVVGLTFAWGPRYITPMSVQLIL